MVIAVAWSFPGCKPSERNRKVEWPKATPGVQGISPVNVSHFGVKIVVLVSFESCFNVAASKMATLTHLAAIKYRSKGGGATKVAVTLLHLELHSHLSHQAHARLRMAS